MNLTQPKHDWHTLSIDQVLTALATSKDGLSAQEAAHRRCKDGPNELESNTISFFTIVISQFNNILVYILFIACGLSIGIPFLEHSHPTLTDFSDAFVILAIIILNAILGVYQEYKADKAIQKLREFNTQSVYVHRKGHIHPISSVDLVKGDIIQIEPGNKIVADCRIIHSHDLKINQSLLTGESDLIHKHTKELPKDTPLAERANMLYSGTFVASGEAQCVVVATGKNSELGAISRLITTTQHPLTPLQRRLQILSQQIGLIVTGLCGILFTIGISKHLEPMELLMMALSLAVSAVPEGLPAIITLTFAFGVKTLSQRHILVRRLDAIETLGSVSVICSDKTGTITENKMTVQVLWHPSSLKDNTQLLTIAASCNQAKLPAIGDPTEIALLEAAQVAKIKSIPIDRIVIPFSSESKQLETQHGNSYFIKGAPEKIINMLHDGDEKKQFHNQAHQMMSAGLRVLACVQKKHGKLTGVGLIGLADPVRKGVKTAVEIAQNAGIRTIMITGDSHVTAKAIATQIGLSGDVITGTQMESLSHQELDKITHSNSIFARILPYQKLEILNSLQRQKEVVAMTGDGINDAPAIKSANVGIAMGKRGADIAKESATIILTDDHYATIVHAIAEGRRLYDNIQRCIVFLLRANFDEILLITTAVFTGMPLPLLPIHILWLNLITDSLPALALTQESPHPDIMTRPPRPRHESILHKKWGLLGLTTLVSFGTSFGLYMWLISVHTPIQEIRSILLTTVIISELLLAFSTRSNKSMFALSPFSNRWLTIAAIVSFSIHIALIYSPLGQFLHLFPLESSDWGYVLTTSLVVFVSLEVLKKSFKA